MPSFEWTTPAGNETKTPWGKWVGSHLLTVTCARVTLDDGRIFEALIPNELIEKADKLEIANAVNTTYQASGRNGIPKEYIAAPEPVKPTEPAAQAPQAE